MPTNTMDMGQFGSQIGKSLMGILGGDNYRKGFEQGGAQAGDFAMKNAQAGLYNAKADAERQRARYQTPEFGNRLAATMAGLVGDQPAQMAQYQAKGNWGERTADFGPETLDANQIGTEAMSTPAWATPEKINTFNQGRAAHLMNLAGTGDTNAQQMAGAYAELRNQGGIDRAIAEPGYAQRFGAAQAAAQGKPLYGKLDGDSAYSLHTGEAAPLNLAAAKETTPILAQLFGTQVAFNGDDQDWSIVPVSTMSDATFKDMATTKPNGINAEMGAKLGFTPDQLVKLNIMYQADPKAAMKLASGVIAQGMKPAPAAKPPAAMQEFLAYQGMDPDKRHAYRQWQESRKPSTNVTVGGSRIAVEAFDKTKGKEFGKLAVEATLAAQNAYDIASDVSMIVEGMRGMGGGPITAFKAWAGKVLPADSDWGRVASMDNLAKQIQIKLAPTMRVAGSGATSDMEMKAYMAAFPSLQSTEHGRKLMGKYMQRIADRAQVRAEIVNEIESAGRLPSPSEINDKMKARLKDKFFDDADKAFFRMNAQGRQPASPPATPVQAGAALQRGQMRDGYRFKGGDPASSGNWERVK